MAKNKEVCSKCGQKWESYSLITGKFYPCGHSNLTKKEQKQNKELLKGINEEIEEV